MRQPILVLLYIKSSSGTNSPEQFSQPDSPKSLEFIMVIVAFKANARPQISSKSCAAVVSRIS